MDRSLGKEKHTKIDTSALRISTSRSGTGLRLQKKLRPTEDESSDVNRTICNQSNYIFFIDD